MDKKFMDYIKENIKEYLPDAFVDASVVIEETLRNNDRICQGLMIFRKGETITPRIYLEDYEKRYEMGEAFEQILQEIAALRVLLDRGDESIISVLEDYDSIKQNLVFSMCDPELNQQQLKYYVHTQCGKYTAMYRVILEQKGNSIASIPVTHNHLKIWRITEKQLYEDTIQAENRRGFGLVRMSELVKEINSYYSEEPFIATNLLEETDNGPGDCMYVLSNPARKFGAGAIMHTELFEKIGQILGCDYFILPASVHELAIIPDPGNQSQQEIEERVREANETQLDPKDIFSYHASFYDHDQKIVLPEKPDEKQCGVQEVTENNLEPLPVLN